MPRKKLELAGKRFGEWLVLERAEGRYWKCRCSCGVERKVRPSCLKREGSCGHVWSKRLAERNKTHGKTKDSIYNVWTGMLARCYNPKSTSYKNYGARGIDVCTRWHRFENFYADMGDKPEGKSLERIDNEKGYSLDNCIWATQKAQMKNTRINRYVTFKGKIQTITEWAKELGMGKSTLRYRLDRGLPVEVALGVKVKSREELKSGW